MKLIREIPNSDSALPEDGVWARLELRALSLKMESRPVLNSGLFLWRWSVGNLELRALSLSLGRWSTGQLRALSLKFSQCFSLHDPKEHIPSNCLICLLETRVPRLCSTPSELLCLEMRPRNNIFFSVRLQKFSFVLKSGCHCLRYLEKWHTVLISKGLTFEWHHSALWK